MNAPSVIRKRKPPLRSTTNRTVLLKVPNPARPLFKQNGIHFGSVDKAEPHGRSHGFGGVYAAGYLLYRANTGLVARPSIQNRARRLGHRCRCSCRGVADPNELGSTGRLARAKRVIRILVIRMYSRSSHSGRAHGCSAFK